jgi:hypothetical protein
LEPAVLVQRKLGNILLKTFNKNFLADDVQFHFRLNVVFFC